MCLALLGREAAPCHLPRPGKPPGSSPGSETRDSRVATAPQRESGTALGLDPFGSYLRIHFRSGAAVERVVRPGPGGPPVGTNSAAVDPINQLSPASSMGPPDGEFRQQHGTTVSPVMEPPLRIHHHRRR